MFASLVQQLAGFGYGGLVKAASRHQSVTLGRQNPAMRRRWHILPGGPVKAGKSHSHLLARAMGAVNTGHLADDDPDDST